MKYIIVGTYGNGKHTKKVYPRYFKYLSQVETYFAYWNEKDADSENGLLYQ